MTIAARIMSVYKRPAPLALSRMLSTFSVKTMVDDVGLGPWWNARRCWLDGAATGSTHVLVIQDDSEPVPDFCDLLMAAIDARPRAIVSLFMHDHKSAIAAGSSPWIEQPIKNWGVALCMPARWAMDMVEWNEKHIKPDMRQDDLRVLHWATNHGLPISCTNPSLVEHSPNMPSTVNERPSNREFMASRLHMGERINWNLPAYQAPGDTRAFLISRGHHRNQNSISPSLIAANVTALESMPSK